MPRYAPHARFAASLASTVLIMVIGGLASATAAPPAAASPAPSLPAATASPPPAACDRTFTLAEPELTESSGLAISRRVPGRFWSHNDSGDRPRLFAFDRTGRKTGECHLAGAAAVDWEDMASYRQGDAARLLVADTGDNASQRDFIELYLFDEPDPDRVTEVADFTRLRITYADGPSDCEAVGVDVVRNQIVLVTKSFYPAARIYLIDLPAHGDGTPARQEVRVRRAGTLPMPLVTAIDVDAASGEIWVTNYFDAFCFGSDDRLGSISDQLLRLPRKQPLPAWRQIEAIGVDDEGRAWITGEATPTPIGRLRRNPSTPALKSSSSATDAPATAAEPTPSNLPVTPP